MLARWLFGSTNNFSEDEMSSVKKIHQEYKLEKYEQSVQLLHELENKIGEREWDIGNRYNWRTMLNHGYCGTRHAWLTEWHIKIKKKNVELLLPLLNAHLLCVLSQLIAEYVPYEDPYEITNKQDLLIHVYDENYYYRETKPNIYLVDKSWEFGILSLYLCNMLNTTPNDCVVSEVYGKHGFITYYPQKPLSELLSGINETETLLFFVKINK
jgi:hypothetical protein